MSYIDPTYWNLSNNTPGLVDSAGILWMQVPTDSVVFWPPVDFMLFLSILGIGLLFLGILAGYEVRKKIERRERK